MNLPRLIIPGFMKCGTSSLQDCLGAHPDVVISEATSRGHESHFFSNEQNYGKGLEHYAASFVDNGPGRVAVDKTPEYIMSSHFLHRIKTDLPLSMLIILLRDPVARCVSHWRHYLSGTLWPGVEIVDFDEALRRALSNEWYFNDFLKRGLYARYLAPAVSMWGLNRIFLTSLEDLVSPLGGQILFDLQIWSGLSPVSLEFGRTNDSIKAMSCNDDAERRALAATPPSEWALDTLRAYYEQPNRDLHRLLGTALTPGWAL